jgi:hypothetical protein
MNIDPFAANVGFLEFDGTVGSIIESLNGRCG